MTVQRSMLLVSALGTGILYATVGAQPAVAQTVQQQIDELRRLMRQQQQTIKEQQGTISQQQVTIEQMQRRMESLQEDTAQTRTTAAEARQQVEEQRRVLSEKPLITSGNPKVKLAISGQINRMVNLADDGKSTKGYFVDNNLSVSRLRFVGEGQVTDDFSIGTNIELGISPNNSNDVSQFNESSGDKFDERKVEALFTSKSLGRVSFGKGDAAAKDIGKIDLSGTDVLAYAGVQDVAGGLYFIEKSDDESSGIQVKNAFTDLDSSRISRVRYDTPKLAGASLAVSAGEDQRYDAALRWAGAFADLKAAAGIGIHDPSSSSVNYRVVGSASVLHSPTGLNLTGAGGGANGDNGAPDTSFVYVKGGWQHDFFSIGMTAFSLDWQQTQDGVTDGDTGNSFGLVALQSLKDYGTEFYAGVRTYDLDQDDEASVSDIIVGTVGTRVKF